MRWSRPRPAGRWSLSPRACPFGTQDISGALEDLKAMANSNGAKALRFESWRLMAAEAFKKKCYRTSASAYRALAERTDFNLTASERVRAGRDERCFDAKLSSGEECSIEIDIVETPSRFCPGWEYRRGPTRSRFRP